MLRVAGMRLGALAMLALTGCVGGAMAPGADEEAIIGGTTDTGDPSVVLLYMTVPGQSGGSLCTGEVVSPHVVLTAAHCTGGENPSMTNATWRVYLGNDFSQATAATLLPVKEAHYNPQFNVNSLMSGYDVGVAILQDALPATVKPLVYNRASMDSGFDGQTVRFVGYGLDNATAQTGAGVKRTTTTTLSDHTAMLLHFSDGTHETCNGDSGGPAFMTVNGQEVIVGLTSFGDVNCAQGGYDTRVDALTAWIDGYVQKADPGFVNGSTGATPPSGTPPSPSGGAQAPPTSSTTPMPPSSAGAGGVGESCVSDNDCASRLCGLSNSGTHMCFPANANSVQGGMGCAVAAGRRREAPNAAMALVLFFSLWLKLVRTRKRQ